MKEFKLQDYVTQIAGIAEANKVGAADAVEYFVGNLNTLSDHYPGATGINIRELGQQWNRLNYKERNKQRRDVVSLVAKKVMPPSTMRSRREE